MKYKLVEFNDGKFGIIRFSLVSVFFDDDSFYDFDDKVFRTVAWDSCSRVDFEKALKVYEKFKNKKKPVDPSKVKRVLSKKDIESLVWGNK